MENPRPPQESGDDESGSWGSYREAIGSASRLRKMLADRDEFESLTLLFEGDPLRLSDVAATWMGENGYLLDRRRLSLKAIALAADRAKELRDDSDLEAWKRTLIADSGRVLLYEETQSTFVDRPAQEPLEPRFLFLQDALGVELGNVRRACTAFNGLPTLERCALHYMLVQRKGFTRYANERGITAREARDLLVRAITAVKNAATGGSNE